MNSTRRPNLQLSLGHLPEAGASQIILGTDYPYGWTEEAVDHVLNQPGLSDAEREAILGGNAVQLLRISS